MPNLPKLRDEHFRLMGMVARLGALIERPEAPRPLHVLALRHELLSTLAAHLDEVHLHLHPRLLSSPDTLIATAARTFSDEMGSLANAYRAHCKQWAAEAIAGDWTGYCVDCRGLLNAVTIRMTRENRELYPLLETVARAA
jgi:hypothetical protein